ncbi:MAG: DUF1559 domain-containing protein, partial [Planctomycetales bacterium]|nr:DUF1559 domain-containing protein [Planctomycetales bacterium]
MSQMPANATTTTLMLVAPALQNARAAARRTQSANNLKQLALAMHNYAAVYGHFPPPVVMGGPKNDVPHSWRIEILPYLEQLALYQAYRMDEPWDSDHNKALIDLMPPLFRHPEAPEGATSSSYYVLTGDSTIFHGTKGTRFEEITDGTSNTLLIIEAERDIPWTKPED